MILETTVEGMHEEYLKRKSRGIPAQMVSQAPVKDVVIRENIDLVSLFPQFWTILGTAILRILGTGEFWGHHT